jgi:hypothetical protein
MLQYNIMSVYPLFEQLRMSPEKQNDTTIFFYKLQNKIYNVSVN